MAAIRFTKSIDSTCGAGFEMTTYTLAGTDIVIVDGAIGGRWDGRGQGISTNLYRWSVEKAGREIDTFRTLRDAKAFAASIA